MNETPDPAPTRKRPGTHVIAFGLRLIWPVFATLALLARRLPERFVLALAAPIGWCLRRSKGRFILSNARRVLGASALAGQKGRQFLKAHLHHSGLSIVEPLIFYGLTHEQMRDRTTIEGEDHLRAVLDRGRGGILLLNHFGSIPAIAAALGSRGYDVTIAGNALDITIGGTIHPLPDYERFTRRMLEYGGVKRATLGRHLPREIAATLKRNGLMGLFFDVPVARKHNEPFQFGHARMLANLGPAILALRTDADVLCVRSQRLGANRHLISISAPLTMDPTTPRHERASSLMQQALNRLRDDLMSRPEQWWQWDFARLCDDLPSPEGVAPQ